VAKLETSHFGKSGLFTAAFKTNNKKRKTKNRKLHEAGCSFQTLKANTHRAGRCEGNVTKKAAIKRN
jgi:hypothetical protein